MQSSLYGLLWIKLTPSQPVSAQYGLRTNRRWKIERKWDKRCWRGVSSGRPVHSWGHALNLITKAHSVFSAMSFSVFFFCVRGSVLSMCVCRAVSSGHGVRLCIRSVCPWCQQQMRNKWGCMYWCVCTREGKGWPGGEQCEWHWSGPHCHKWQSSA